MIQYTKNPLFFERNRVWRVYRGGYLFHEFLGDEKEDNHYPEEWVASTVKAINDKSAGAREGLSILEGTDITLKELMEAYPTEMLGERKNFGILVKYLDSAIRLPLQAHPDRAFSETYFNSSYGKTEMWLILATRENANICFGFKDKITKEQFSDIIERSKTDKKIMDKYLNVVPVKPGEVYLIPAKAVHAIGYGCLILEVQEPTDFTIQPEYWCGEHLLNNQEMYMGLPKEIALQCFEYNVYGKDCIKNSRKQPNILAESDNYRKEALISKKDTPCFCVNRYCVSKWVVLQEAPAIYVVTEGSGRIEGEKYQRKIQKGDYFFLPKNGEGKFSIFAKKDAKIGFVECIPPEDKETDLLEKVAMVS